MPARCCWRARDGLASAAAATTTPEAAWTDFHHLATRAHGSTGLKSVSVTHDLTVTDSLMKFMRTVLSDCHSRDVTGASVRLLAYGLGCRLSLWK
jgi:hypothetical protein